MSGISPELYRDPVYDGATDPKVVIDRDGLWWMLYTQRRATHPDPGPGVAWVHGSRIGVATSPDGLEWTYRGTLEPRGDGLTLTPGAPPDPVDRTHWAPEVVWDGARWRMLLTEIDGVPDRWPGFARTIVVYRSDDLDTWQRDGALSLASDRVIDAGVARTPDGLWRLWYKDEAAGSVTKAAGSSDFSTWTDEGTAIDGRGHEGPDVFDLGGSLWMIVDEWRGMAVHRSDDGIRWERQGGPDDVILAAGPGGGFLHHGAHVRDGDRVWFYAFGRPVPGGADALALTAAVDDGGHTGGASVDERRSAVYRVELVVIDGRLTVKP